GVPEVSRLLLPRLFSFDVALGCHSLNLGGWRNFDEGRGWTLRRLDNQVKRRCRCAAIGLQGTSGGRLLRRGTAATRAACRLHGQQNALPGCRFGGRNRPAASFPPRAPVLRRGTAPACRRSAAAAATGGS